MQWRKFGLLMYYYWHRNFGTAMSWFVWDFAFYVSRAADGGSGPRACGAPGIKSTAVLYRKVGKPTKLTCLTSFAIMIPTG
mgnify:CR=1 FL=1